MRVMDRLQLARTFFEAHSLRFAQLEHADFGA
jgi:hypothetical protein